MVASMSLLIYNASKTIQFAWASLNFTMLAQYVSNNEEMLHYMEHGLYKLDKKNNIWVTLANWLQAISTNLLLP